MLTVDDYAKIRLAHRDGMSIHELARTFHHSRYKIRQILQQAQPQPYTRRKPPPAPILGPFHAAIDAILAADEDAPPKQRHTAMQIFRRLRDEHGFRGGYNAVRRYLGKQRRAHRETFIPLAHDPGQRLECDFGHIHVDFPEVVIGAQNGPTSARKTVPPGFSCTPARTGVSHLSRPVDLVPCGRRGYSPLAG